MAADPIIEAMTGNAVYADDVAPRVLEEYVVARRREETDVEARVAIGLAAVEALYAEREGKRRAASLSTFGHPGAHIPEFFVSRTDVVRAVVVALEEAT